MSVEEVIVLLEPAGEWQQRFCAAMQAFGCRVQTVCVHDHAFDQIRRASPDVLIVSEALTAGQNAALCRRVRADDLLKSCSILLLTGEAASFANENGAAGAWSELGDDLLSRHAAEWELRARVEAALRLAQLRRQMQAMRQELEYLRGEQERSGDFMTETTTQLVEIAAELQSEVCHSVEREEESVRMAQSDTIAQAAAALRHEINNPLFAIVGSAESALKRLRAADGDCQPDLVPIIVSMERVLRGADRIQQVVLTISHMLTPVTTDYVPGVPMLDLHQS